MQAILTRYMNPTNTRGAKIKATAAAGSVTINYPHGLSEEDAHRAAAQALVQKLGWVPPHYGALHGGQLPSGDWCFVMVPSPAANARAVLLAAIAEGQFSSTLDEFARNTIKDSRPVTAALGTERARQVVAACCAFLGA